MKSNTLPPFPKFQSPFVPFDDSVVLYDAVSSIFPQMEAYEYTGWRDEQMAWKDTCYLHGGLNPTTTSRIAGPDAEKFLTEACVNTMKNFTPGKGKQAILCDEEGYVAANGVLIRTAEDEFYSYWLEPYLSYAATLSDYDVQVETLTGQVFLFQLAGPKSLEIIENASGEDFHDVCFLHHKTGHIAGHDIRVIRIGMAGSLAYEVHGNIEDAYDVYNALYKTGTRYGIKKLGRHGYFMNHTLGGYTQPIVHFNLRITANKGYMTWLDKMGMPAVEANIIKGSMGDQQDLSFTYRTPMECGWQRVVNFDHEFRGKAALLEEHADPKRTMVTLEWNVEDIMAIHRSQYDMDSEPYAPMDDPSEYQRPATLWQDRVEDMDGNLIGISSGREYSTYYRQMISLCTINIKWAEEGKEVVVVYGDPGTRQKKIRARVARFPYFIDGRNQDVDVDSIPRLKK